MSSVSRVFFWKELPNLDDILILRDPERNLDFLIHGTRVGGTATIVYFRNRDVQNQLELLFTFRGYAQYAGHDGIRVERDIEEVKAYLAILPQVEEKK